MSPPGELTIIQNLNVKARLNRKPGSGNYETENPLKYNHNFAICPNDIDNNSILIMLWVPSCIEYVDSQFYFILD